MNNLSFFIRSNIKFLLVALIVLQVISGKAQELVNKRSTLIEQYKGLPYYLHFVKAGEKLSEISKLYNITQQELILENPFLEDGLKIDQVLRIPKRPEVREAEIKEKQDLVSPTYTSTGNSIDTKGKPGIGKASIYIVKKQETLYGISRQFNVTIEELKKANPTMIELQEGMELIIPGYAKDTTSSTNYKDTKPVPNIKPDESPKYQEVVVKQGQTIYSISKQFGLTTDQFLKLNPQVTQGLKTDQIVIVPAHGGSTGNPGPGNHLQIHENTGDKNKVDSALQSGTSPIISGNSAPECKNNSHLNKTYEIALLLPFDLENSDSIFSQEESSSLSAADFKSFDFFQFYCGMIMAADSLEKVGFKAHINVFDADKESDTLKIKKALRKNNLSDMDLVIGPVYAKSFEVASRYAKKEKVRIINPLSKRNRLLAGNPYVYMVQSSDEFIASGMARFIAKNYIGNNILLCRNGPKELESFYAFFIRELKKHETESNLTIKEINYQSESFSGLAKRISENTHNVVLMFSDSRSMVPNFVSLLNAGNKFQNITLFGLPGWENLGIETEFLSKLDYHLCGSSFVNYRSETVDQFVKRFRSAYATEPLIEKHAFLGYDIGWYFFQALMNYGTEFDPCLKYMNMNGLQTNFNFGAESPSDGFQNESFRVIQLKDYKWIESN